MDVFKMNDDDDDDDDDDESLFCASCLAIVWQQESNSIKSNQFKRLNSFKTIQLIQFK